ncbi:MAG: tyrosine-type recombinase/integrase [Candidatus Latescibacteria bacterium]|nr:tyrosine-type recombinase/integrase [Candidatus Latescibacterota bacterium]
MRPISSFQVPTPEELTALRAVPKHRRDQALIEVLAGCGLRVSEVCALQVAHLHWTGEAPFLRIVGKGGQERRVPLNLQTQDALRAWLEARPRFQRFLVFCNLRTGKQLTRKAVWAALRRHSRQAGLRSLSPHLLRHSFGAGLAQRQVPLAQISALMGHASMLSAQRYLAAGTSLPAAVAQLDQRSSLARWWSCLRNRSYRFFGESLPTPAGTTSQTVGRQTELQQLQAHADQRVDTLLLGPAGVGKSHLLAQLSGERLIRLVRLSPPKQALLEIAEALHSRGVFQPTTGASSLPTAGEPVPPSAAESVQGPQGESATGRSAGRAPQEDFEVFKKQHHRTSIQGWLRLVLDAVEKDQWVLVIDDLSGLSPYLGRLLDQLGGKFRIIAALREVKRGYTSHFSRFERLSLANLSRRETQQLLRQHLAGLAVEDRTLLETHLWEHSGGNPRALLEMIERLRREPGVSCEAVRQLHHPGAHRQIDLTPIILIPAVLLVAARFIARGLGDTEAYILAGIGAALVMGAQFFLFRMRR